MLQNTTTRRIEWGDCDPAGIVFNPNFFKWFDHSTALLYETAGWSKPVMMREFEMAGCPLVATNATFRAPCRFGEDVTITSAMTDVRKSSFDITHKLTKGETLCVEGQETRVWTVRDEASGGIRSAAIPEIVVARFKGEPD